MMQRQRLCILGSTGSIGTNTLDVVSRHPEQFEVFALTAHSQVERLFEQCLLHKPQYVVLSTALDANALRSRLQQHGQQTEVLVGAQALVEIASHAEVDIVMAAIVGAAGLLPCLAAVRQGKRLLLANKEALVIGGSLLMQAAREAGALVLPIDSEHSAIFQCLPGQPAEWTEAIDHIVLTASGGPFRDRAVHTFGTITPSEACSHPNWVMGRKISVDSATMMNKALEVIEARWLFDLAPEQIRVVIHPQSIIHSMVVYRDQSILAQLGTPDMRVPIAYGLSWPKRMESGVPALDFTSLKALTFEAPDLLRYPSLALAWQTLKAVNGSTAVLNAANEIAVEAFLDQRLRFDRIYAINAEVLARTNISAAASSSIGDLLELDTAARALARELVGQERI